MKPDALLCTVGTSMFGRMPEMRQLAPEAAAARLLALNAPCKGGAENESLEHYCRRICWSAMF